MQGFGKNNSILALDISEENFVKWSVIIITILIAVRTVFLLQHSWSFITDDAYISFRYARNLADGYGLRFNPGGERIEGYSNPLWVGLSAFWYWVGIDAVRPMRIISVGSLFGSCFFMYLISRRWVGPILALLPPWLMTSYLGQIYWTVSGLETSFYQFLVISLVWCAGRTYDGLVSQEGGCERGGGGGGWLFGLLGFAVSLARPEGPLIVFVVIFAVIVGGFRRKNFGERFVDLKLVKFLSVVFLSFVVPYVVYFIVRWMYFGNMLPHTVICKASYEIDPWKLIRDFWEESRIFIFLTLTIRPKKVGPLYILVLGIPLVYGLILYGANPVIGHENRHFLTAYAMVFVGSVVGMANVTEFILPHMRTILREFLVVGLFVSQIGSIGIVAEGLENRSTRYKERMTAREAVASWLNDNLQSDEYYVIGDAGLIPYLANAKALDAFCLNNSDATDSGRRVSLDEYIDSTIGRKPKVIVAHSKSLEQYIARPAVGFYASLMSREEVRRQYNFRAKFGQKGDAHHYWIFMLEEDG